jgi:curli production assembly/transport component CsgE
MVLLSMVPHAAALPEMSPAPEASPSGSAAVVQNGFLFTGRLPAAGALPSGDLHRRVWTPGIDTSTVRDSSSSAEEAIAPAPVLETGLAMTYSSQMAQRRRLHPRRSVDGSEAGGGLVVDETLTPQGRRFYDAFYGVWEPPSTSGFYTVRIEEGPAPGRGTLLRVLVNDDTTFRLRLHPQKAVADAALQAARRTYRYVRSGQGILTIH